MRRFDKNKNIKNINLLCEQRYLQSKGLLKENDMFEGPMQQGPSNEDYVEHFLNDFYTGLHLMDLSSDLEDLFVEFKLRYNDDDAESIYWVYFDFVVEGAEILLHDLSFDIGWDDKKEEFLRSFEININTKSFKPVIDFIEKEFIRRYDNNKI
jgi:hypothetical protein